jgi:hypothetical protein
MKAYIAFHEERGIYLGVFAGYALFSGSPIAFSSKAIRFDTEEDIYEFFSKAASKIISEEIKAIPVETSSVGNYVDLVDILKSGHKKHTESMLDNLPTLSDTIH